MPYIDPSTISQVKQIDLLAYLQEREPDELVKIGLNAYATKTHDSLKISNGKWYWWSRGFGGRTALDYLIKVRDMKFTEAVNHLAGRLPTPAPACRPATKTPSKQKRLVLPPGHADASVAASYLESRGIARSVIDHCIAEGTVYESRRGNLRNVVFVGLDGRGTPRYAAIRGCRGRYRGEAEGSDKRYAFRLADYPLNSVVHVFESAVDALSYATLLEMQGRDWRRENLIALARHLADNPGTETLRLRLDNDPAGLNAAALVSALLSARCEVRIEPPGTGKDVNDELMALAGKPMPAAKEHAR